MTGMKEESMHGTDQPVEQVSWICGIFIDRHGRILFERSRKSKKWIVPGEQFDPDDHPKKYRFLWLERNFRYMLNCELSIERSLLAKVQLYQSKKLSSFDIYRVVESKDASRIRVVNSAVFISPHEIEDRNEISPAAKKIVTAVLPHLDSNVTTLLRIAS